ncbi:MAG: DUF2095 family protein [Candidatus Methanomethylicaceae archaeon]
MKGFSKEELKKDFPNLVKELEDAESIENLNIKIDRSRGYTPNVIDFIMRCEKNEEAIEIIDYLEKRKEITSAYAESLRKQVNEKGVRSFGKKRTPGYYFRAFGKK